LIFQAVRRDEQVMCKWVSYLLNFSTEIKSFQAALAQGGGPAASCKYRESIVLPGQTSGYQVVSTV